MVAPIALAELVNACKLLIRPTFSHRLPVQQMIWKIRNEVGRRALSFPPLQAMAGMS